MAFEPDGFFFQVFIKLFITTSNTKKKENFVIYCQRVKSNNLSHAISHFGVPSRNGRMRKLAKEVVSSYT